MNDAPRGVYYSGLGGLTVWREVRRMLPSESLVYLGDGKNCHVLFSRIKNKTAD